MKEVLHLLLTGLTWFVVVGTFLTFIPPHKRNGVINKVVGYFDRLMAAPRRFIPPIGGVDLSPLIVIILLQVADRLIRRL